MISREDLERLVDEGKVTLFLCPHVRAQEEIHRLKERLRDFLDSEKEHREEIRRLESTLHAVVQSREGYLSRAKWLTALLGATYGAIAGYGAMQLFF